MSSWLRSEFVRERVIAVRLFHRVEVFALHVLDDRDFERVAIADFHRHDRHLVQAGNLRGAPAAFTGDDLEAIGDALHWPHHDRLDHAALPDRIGELAEFGIRKCAARITRIGLEEFDRHLALTTRPLDMRRLAANIPDQACKPATQSRTRFVGHRQLPWIHSRHSNIRISGGSDRRVGKGALFAPCPPWSDREKSVGTLRFAHPTASTQCASNSRSRWITSVASLRYASLPTHLRS